MRKTKPRVRIPDQRIQKSIIKKSFEEYSNNRVFESPFVSNNSSKHAKKESMDIDQIIMIKHSIEVDNSPHPNSLLSKCASNRSSNIGQA